MAFEVTLPGASRMHRFRLLDEAGTDLGPFVSARAVWALGETVARGATERFEVINVVPAEESAAFLAYLVVRRE